MKVLLDACVWGGAREDLRRAGHEVDWEGEWRSDPGDAMILERANREGRILITLDKDFGELAVVRRLKHAGIVRLVGLPARRQGSAGVAVLAKYEEELTKGGIVTVEPDRVRVRPAEP